MALKLSKETDEGISFEYWRINPAMNVDMVDRTATANILIYKDAAARQASKKPIMHVANSDTPRMVTLSGTDFESAVLTGDLRAAMYVLLKTFPFFLGAEDV